MLQFAFEAAKLFFLGPVKSRKDLVSGDAARDLCPGLLHSLGGSRVVVLDVPLLFESGIDKLCSETVFVDAPDEVQLTRLMARDKLSQPEAQKKIDAQMSNERKRARSTRVIANCGSVADLHVRTAAWLRASLSRLGIWSSTAVTHTDRSGAVPAPERDEHGAVTAPASPEAYRTSFEPLVPSWWALALPWRWSVAPSVPAVIVAATAALPCYFVSMFGERLLAGPAKTT
jgi:hypothetical protein